MIQDILGAFSALLFILAILAILAWSVRRFGLIPSQPRIHPDQKKINIIESRMLDGRNRLVAVEWQGREYLLATNPAGVTPISINEHDFRKMVHEHKVDKYETS